MRLCRSARAAVLGALVLAVGTPLVAASPHPGARSGAGAWPTACATAEDNALRLVPDLSQIAGERLLLTRAGEFDLAATRWRFDAAPQAQLWLHGAGWLASYARIDAADATELALEQAAVNPDPGMTVTRAELSARGWQESAVTLRMATISCLYQLTRDERLRPVMEALVQANLDPDRYYGPPRRPPHNHGAMANRALLRAASVFALPEWAAAARARLAEAVDLVFDECGMTFEQSSGYHVHNVRLWSSLADEVPGSALSAALLRARAALARLLRPDGVLPAIGNALPVVRPLGEAPSGTAMWCPQTGWAVYSAPRTLVPVHSVLRFGPSRRMHGHHDGGSFTWWLGGADGIPVLSDPGLGFKEPASRAERARSRDAHTVFDRPARPFLSSWRGSRLTSPVGAVFRFRTRSGADTVERRIRFNTQVAAVSVRDSTTLLTPRRRGERYVQRFTLDPIWLRPAQQGAPVSGGGVTAVTASGRTLSVVCISGGEVLRPRVRDVESYVAREVAVPSLQVVCSHMARASVQMQAVLLLDQQVISVVTDPREAVIVTSGGELTLTDRGQLMVRRSVPG